MKQNTKINRSYLILKSSLISKSPALPRVLFHSQTSRCVALGLSPKPAVQVWSANALSPVCHSLRPHLPSCRPAGRATAGLELG